MLRFVSSVVAVVSLLTACDDALRPASADVEVGAEVSASTDVGATQASDAGGDGEVTANDSATGDGVAFSDKAAALVERMRNEDGDHYRAALDAGVTFLPTSDGLTFYALWLPPGFDPTRDGVVVTLPGHDTFASTAFTVWQADVAERSYGFIGLHWWIGTGETSADYLTPDDMIGDIHDALAALEVPPGRVLLEGFSRGSANSYAVTALDHVSVAPAFLLTIASSGRMVPTYPPNVAIENGSLGPAPLAGTHWVLFCGAHDQEMEQGGCEGMRASETWLVGKGAVIDIFIEDPNQGHGGFHLNHANAERALDLYDEMLGRLEGATPAR